MRSVHLYPLAFVLLGVVALPSLAMADDDEMTFGEGDDEMTFGDDEGEMTFGDDEESTDSAGDDQLSAGSEEAAPEVTLGAAAAEIMDGALKKYDGKDFAGSSLEFYRVVAAAGDVEAEKYRQKAEYMLGRALYQMGYYQSSLLFFQRVVDEGAGHRYYRATHKMLYLLYKKLGDPRIVERIARYDRSEYDERFRDDLLFVVGKFHYDRGGMQDALSHLQAITRGSRYYAKAKFLEGILYVRKYEAPPAVEAFKEILRVVAADPGSVKDPTLYQRLAWLSLARIFYSTGQFELALKYYDKVPMESPQWLPALLESAWTFFQLDNFEKALGNLHTLQSPYFADEYFPESHVLRSVIYFTTCNYEQVRGGVDAFMNIYEDLKGRLDGFLDEYRDPPAFWSFLVTLNRAGAAEFGARTQQIFNAAFSDRSLTRMHRYINRVESELESVRSIEGVWGASPLAQQLREEIAMVKTEAVSLAGEMAQARLTRVRNELREHISQMRKVKFETANAEMGQLENRIRDEQYNPTDVRGVDDLKATDDEHLYWSFEGEYWKDELGSYVYTVPIRCGR